MEIECITYNLTRNVKTYRVIVVNPGMADIRKTGLHVFHTFNFGEDLSSKVKSKIITMSFTTI